MAIAANEAGETVGAALAWQSCAGARVFLRCLAVHPSALLFPSGRVQNCLLQCEVRRHERVARSSKRFRSDDPVCLHRTPAAVLQNSTDCATQELPTYVTRQLDYVGVGKLTCIWHYSIGDRLPARSTLLRFLATLTPDPIEALRALFLSELLACPLGKEPQEGGCGIEAAKSGSSSTWMGHARRLANGLCPRLQIARCPSVACAPSVRLGLHGTQARRGRAHPRTTVLQAHTHQWLGMFGNPGNGEYRVELFGSGASEVIHEEHWRSILAPGRMT
jgi:hypothetical protein